MTGGGIEEGGIGGDEMAAWDVVEVEVEMSVLEGEGPRLDRSRERGKIKWGPRSWWLGLLGKAEIIREANQKELYIYLSDGRTKSGITKITIVPLYLFILPSFSHAKKPFSPDHYVTRTQDSRAENSSLSSPVSRKTGF